MNAISAQMSDRAMPVVDEPAILAAYFSQVASYQANNARRDRRSKVAAWIVAGAAGAIALSACVAVAALTPLKTIVPPLVFRVDSATGMVDRVYDVIGGEMAASDAERRYFLWNYVRLRHSYAFAESKDRFDAVNLMSTQDVQAQYADAFRGSNPMSPQVILGRTGRATVQWVSTQFSPSDPKVAYVRFRLMEWRGDTALPARPMIASIAFDFAKGSVTGSDLNVNPNGFLVTSYRADQENTQ